MLKKLPLYLLFILSSLSSFSQDLEFYREELFFEVKEQIFYVTGIYYFTNESDQTIMKPLFYPFPINKTEYGDIDSIVIIDINAKANVQYFPDSMGVNFYIFLEAKKSTKYLISYQQKLLSNKAEYIFLPKQNGDKPFDQAYYQLTLTDCKINSFSIKPDSSSISNGKSLYFWKKHNYMPDTNMVFGLKYPDIKK